MDDTSLVVGCGKANSGRGRSRDLSQFIPPSIAVIYSGATFPRVNNAGNVFLLFSFCERAVALHHHDRLYGIARVVRFCDRHVTALTKSISCHLMFFVWCCMGCSSFVLLPRFDSLCF